MRVVNKVTPGLRKPKRYRDVEMILTFDRGFPRYVEATPERIADMERTRRAVEKFAEQIKGMRL